MTRPDPGGATLSILRDDNLPEGEGNHAPLPRRKDP